MYLVERRFGMNVHDKVVFDERPRSAVSDGACCVSATRAKTAVSIMGSLPAVASEAQPFLELHHGEGNDPDRAAPSVGSPCTIVRPSPRRQEKPHNA